jgi:hypothetical protein
VCSYLLCLGIVCFTLRISKPALKFSLSLLLLCLVEYSFAFLFIFYCLGLESVRAGHDRGVVSKEFPRGHSRAWRSRTYPALTDHFSSFSFMLGFRARSLLSCLFLLISTVNALHFYLDANEKRCFIEELPTDTVVEGKHHHKMYVYYPGTFSHSLSLSLGHYRAMEWSEQGNVYSINEQLGILVEVTVRDAS